MEDKCFCHLNGFAVKDATARNEINNIKLNYATKDELNNFVIPEVDLTSYATKDYVDGKTVNYTTLYDNETGTQEGFELTDNISNYDYVEIFYTHGTGNHCVKAIAKNENVICLDGFYIDGNALYLNQKQIKITGNTVVVESTGGATVSSTEVTINNNSSCTIHRVIGIKL